MAWDENDTISKQMKKSSTFQRIVKNESYIQRNSSNAEMRRRLPTFFHRGSLQTIVGKKAQKTKIGDLKQHHPRQERSPTGAQNTPRRRYDRTMSAMAQNNAVTSVLYPRPAPWECSAACHIPQPRQKKCFFFFPPVNLAARTGSHRAPSFNDPKKSGARNDSTFQFLFLSY